MGEMNRRLMPIWVHSGRAAGGACLRAASDDEDDDNIGPRNKFCTDYILGGDQDIGRELVAHQVAPLNPPHGGGICLRTGCQHAPPTGINGRAGTWTAGWRCHQRPNMARSL